MRGCTSGPDPAATEIFGRRTVSLRRILTWLVVALVLVYVVKSPDHAAAFLRSAGTSLGHAVSSLASFVGSLA